MRRTTMSGLDVDFIRKLSEEVIERFNTQRIFRQNSQFNMSVWLGRDISMNDENLCRDIAAFLTKMGYGIKFFWYTDNVNHMAITSIPKDNDSSSSIKEVSEKIEELMKSNNIKKCEIGSDGCLKITF